MRRRFLEWLGTVDPRLRVARLGPEGQGALLLGAAGFVLLCCASLAVRTGSPTSAALAAAFVLLAGVSGYVLRASLRYPFGLVLVILAVIGAAGIAPDREGRQLLAVAGPLALLASILLGALARRGHRDRSRSDDYEAAVQAQILDERSHDVTRLSNAMVRVLQTTHDASSTLSTALINAELLRKASEARSRGEKATLDEEETALDLARQLARLRELVEEARAVGHGGAEPVESLEPVAPLPVANDVVRAVGVRFPGVRIEVSASVASSDVMVSGGAKSLQRILVNLVENACQGDGRRGAQHVALGVEEARTVGSVAIRVADDGPGFTDAQLDAPIHGFETTKGDGTGLGLYTVERLARASGGSVSRENGIDAGAVVTVYLKAVLPA